MNGQQGPDSKLDAILRIATGASLLIPGAGAGIAPFLELLRGELSGLGYSGGDLEAQLAKMRAERKASDESRRESKKEFDRRFGSKGEQEDGNA